MSEALESLLPCHCGAEAELHEWEERDATRWAARAKCNCGWEGPIGYADNHRGCFDAVNDLHKKRAIAKWNNRPAKTEVAPEDEIEWLHAWLNTAQRTGIESVIPIMRKRMQKLMIGKGDMCPRPSVDIDAAVKVYEDAACKEIYKMREGVAAVLRYAQQAEIDPLSPEGQRLLYERSPSEEVRTNVGSDNLSDQDRKEMGNSLKEWANSPEAAREELLHTIDIKAEAGLCQMTHSGTRAFLKDIRAIIKEASNG
jgi:hypothetical protein